MYYVCMLVHMYGAWISTGHAEINTLKLPTLCRRRPSGVSFSVFQTFDCTYNTLQGEEKQWATQHNGMLNPPPPNSPP